MKILITGAAGFIGSHLANHYLKKGYSVLGIDHYGSGFRGKICPGVKMEKVNLRDPTATREALSRFQPDIISHHAAHIDPRESWDDPEDDALDNIFGTIQLLKVMRELPCSRLIFASSCAIYGDQPVMDEGTLPHPKAPYGAAKVAAETYIEMYCRMLPGNRFVVLRYPNIYAEAQRGDRSTGVIAIFVEQLLSKKPVTPTLYGNASYQYLHMDDLLRAHDKAVEWTVSSSEGEFLLANLPGHSASTSSIYTAISALVQSPLRAKVEPPRFGEQKSIVMSGDVAKGKLGWTREISLMDGLKRVVECKRGEPTNYDK
jgi:UDP-glucose 4-epimerase